MEALSKFYVHFRFFFFFFSFYQRVGGCFLLTFLFFLTKTTAKFEDD